MPSAQHPAYPLPPHSLHPLSVSLSACCVRLQSPWCVAGAVKSRRCWDKSTERLEMYMQECPCIGPPSASVTGNQVRIARSWLPGGTGTGLLWARGEAPVEADGRRNQKVLLLDCIEGQAGQDGAVHGLAGASKCLPIQTPLGGAVQEGRGHRGARPPTSPLPWSGGCAGFASGSEGEVKVLRKESEATFPIFTLGQGEQGAVQGQGGEERCFWGCFDSSA